MKQVVFTTPAALQINHKQTPTKILTGRLKSFLVPYSMPLDWTVFKYKNMNTGGSYSRVLKISKTKVVYCLCEATNNGIPFYIGETNNPAKRIHTHFRETSLNTTYHTKYEDKCDIFEQLNNNGIQTVLIPLLQVPYILSVPYEIIVRCLFTEFDFPLTNKHILTDDIIDFLKNTSLKKDSLYPYMLNILLKNANKNSKTLDLLLEHIS